MKRSQQLAVNAVLFTLLIIFVTVPISIGPVRLAALMLLPVIVAGETQSLKTAVTASLFLGLLSCVTSWIMPVSPTAYMFRNPLVSVLPRLFIGLSVYGADRLGKMINKKNSRTLSVLFSGMGAAVGVVTNTGLVLAMMWALYRGKTIGGTMISAEFMSGLIALNFVIEIVACTILAPPIVYALRKMLSKQAKEE